MLGNGARFLGPSAAGNAAGSTNNQQHQSPFGRGIWPTATTFQANGGECKYPSERVHDIRNGARDVLNLT